MTLIIVVVVLMLLFGRFLNTDLRAASGKEDA
jgi:Sec-independent protein translocase protein TatA